MTLEQRYRPKNGQWGSVHSPIGFRQLLQRLTSVLTGTLVLITGCQATSPEPPRQVLIQQTWELEPGDTIAGYRVTASLGDISIRLNGHAVYAPFSGKVELAASRTECVYFSSPEVPAYLFRFCGLHRPQLGAIAIGSSIGAGELVHFATLRRQPDGSWAIVEPSSQVLQRALRSNIQSFFP